MKKKKSRFKSIKKKAIALLMPLVRPILHYWLHTLRFDQAAIAKLPHKPQEQAILIAIHEEIMPFIAYTGMLIKKNNADFVGLTSLHRDSNIIDWLLRRRQLQVIRGSSTKGGNEALSNLIKCISESKTKSAAIAVDGPQGPRRIVKPGAILLAKKKSLPIYLIRFHYNGWRLRKSWDKNLIPKPLNKIKVSSSQAITVNRKSNVADIQQRIEQLISEMD